MKKLITMLLILALLLPAVALAELTRPSDNIPDLSGMTLAELEDLRKAVCSEILSRSKWESVTVPAGFYVIGEDIPAGHWTIRYNDPYAVVIYFTKANETGRVPDYFNGSAFQVNIGAPGNELDGLYNIRETDIDLKPGCFLTVEFGSVIFEPFTGRKSPFN